MNVTTCQDLFTYHLQQWQWNYQMPRCHYCCKTSLSVEKDLAKHYTGFDGYDFYLVPFTLYGKFVLSVSELGDSSELADRPCAKNPCGPHAICWNSGENFLCTCSDPDYSKGNPYQECHECLYDQHCNPKWDINIPIFITFYMGYNKCIFF